jgi:hypothetical protein
MGAAQRWPVYSRPVRQVCRDCYGGIRTSDAIDARIAALLERAREKGIPMRDDFKEKKPDLVPEMGKAAMLEAWNGWFPRPLQEQEPNYRINRQLIEGGWEDGPLLVSHKDP